MGRFLLRRAILAVLVCSTVLVISFALTRVAGDPALAVAGPQATAADLASIRTAYGLDRPLPAQFIDWVAAAAHGDLGRSYLFREPVANLVAARLPVTLTLGLVGLSFAILIAVPLGMLAALNEGRPLDRIVTGLIRLPLMSLEAA
jgi:peptide/nickel transport system permease protein